VSSLRTISGRGSSSSCTGLLRRQTMKVCGACSKEMPKDGFSSKQWKMKAHERRCKVCVSDGTPVKLLPPDQGAANDDHTSTETQSQRTTQDKPRTSPGFDEDAPACWICLEPSDDKGNAAQRDCSCRGKDAGWVHMSCLKEFAYRRSDAATSFDSCMRPWQYCDCCKQKYQGKLAVRNHNPTRLPQRS